MRLGVSLFRLGDDAARSLFFSLHALARRRGLLTGSIRRAERATRADQHANPDRVVDRDGVNVVVAGACRWLLSTGSLSMWCGWRCLSCSMCFDANSRSWSPLRFL